MLSARKLVRTLIAPTAALTLSLGIAQDAGAVIVQMQVIGNAGNAADPLTGFGAVAYEYRIGKREVTNTQYAEFLNAVAASDPYGLWDSNMGVPGGNIRRVGTDGSYTYIATQRLSKMPVALIGWFDAARFANWMHGGQGNASTETGAYTLLGAQALPNNWETVQRNPNARYFIPDHDEWYKAAYHDASAGTAGDYFLYANGSNTAPAAADPGIDPTGANYDNAVSSGNSPVVTLSRVGAYTGAPSPYGTFDQNGNVAEAIEGRVFPGSRTRARRGGSWVDDVNDLRADQIGSFPDLGAGQGLGFRLAAPIPEPSSAALLVIGGALIARRRRS